MRRAAGRNRAGGGSSRRDVIAPVLTVLALVLALLVGASAGAGAAVNDPANPTPSVPTTGGATTTWDHSKSKVATNLNDDLRSTVTLSLPSAEDEFTSDVVFVLDTSDCVGDVMTQVQSLVTQLKEAHDANPDANIRVGVVVFKGSAGYLFNGSLVDVDTAVTQLTQMAAAVAGASDQEAAVLSYLTPADDKALMTKGSNFHSGLMAAKSLLDGDTEVAASRKYLVTVSDELTYYWNDDAGNVYGVYDHSVLTDREVTVMFYSWCKLHGVSIGDYSYGSDSDLGDWDSYVARTRQLIQADGATYVSNLRDVASKTGRSWSGIRTFDFGTGANDNNVQSELVANGFSYVGTATDASNMGADETATLSQHALGIDHANIACLDTYQALVDEGYHCYAYCTDTYGEGTFPYLFTQQLNKLAGVTGQVSFEDIADDVLYLCDAGSSVEDVLGYVAGDDGYDFDLVTPADGGTLSVTVEGSGTDELDVKPGTYQAVQIEENHWGFAPGSYTSFDANGEEVTHDYAYELVYTPGEGAAEKLTWTTNVPVSNFQHVSLSYTVELTNPQTTAGTYGSYDADGSDNDGSDAYGLYTNTSAILTPVSTLGVAGAAEAFAKPTVSYAVAAPEPTTTTVSVTKVWKDVAGKDADAPAGAVVTVDVLDGDGTTMDTLTLSAETQWQATSKALPADGTYTVAERAFDGYASAVSGSAAEGFTVTNTAKAPETPKNGATKPSTLPTTGDPTSLAASLASLVAGLGSVAGALGLRRRDRR